MAKVGKRVLIGHVVSDRMDKTIVVRVERKKRHPLYGKVVRVSKKYKAHDESNEARMGDTVSIIESRPLSKEKRWRMTEVLEKTKR
ncbi:MAG: 30S ribosomal protein S17 [Anaerolineaceae bacterium 4572_78]|nr:MAG: 30S ribosomal protein S17 [Anaerolineaceae bacterium 4572_78]